MYVIYSIIIQYIRYSPHLLSNPWTCVGSSLHRIHFLSRGVMGLVWPHMVRNGFKKVKILLKTSCHDSGNVGNNVVTSGSLMTQFSIVYSISCEIWIRYRFAFMLSCYIIILNWRIWFIYAYTSGLPHWHWSVLSLSQYSCNLWLMCTKPWRQDMDTLFA